MKITRSILLTLIVIISIQKVQAQVTNPDTMVHKIFTALKNKDEKAFVALYPNQEQMLKLLSRFITSMATQLEKLDSTKKQLPSENFGKDIVDDLKKKTSPEEMTKLYDGFAKNFKAIIEKGEQREINWSKIVLTNYTYDTASIKDEAMMKLFGSDGFKTMKGTIFFTAADSAWQINIKEVIYLPEEGGWYGGELKQLTRKGEKLEPEWGAEEIDAVKDDAIVEPPPPSKPKTKTKTKTSTTKTKTKTKS